MSDGTFKCRLCQVTFVDDGTFIPICSECCDTLVEPIGGWEAPIRVLTPPEDYEEPCGCDHCGSFDHESWQCITSDEDVWEDFISEGGV